VEGKTTIIINALWYGYLGRKISGGKRHKRKGQQKSSVMHAHPTNQDTRTWGTEQQTKGEGKGKGGEGRARAGLKDGEGKHSVP